MQRRGQRLKKYVIGLDFGTLSARALLAETDTGRVMASAESVYPHGVITEHLPEGWALQHPQDYLDALYALIPEVMKTAVAELSDEPRISVMGRTIYVNGMPCGECALYDIAGKRLYACRNATNTQITVPVAGVFVLMVCGEQHNVAVK